MTVIVFSKDRPLQLDAFLRSYKTHVSPRMHVRILYTASDARYEHAYFEVFARHLGFITAFRQGVFKVDLLEMLPPSGVVVFFVDDQLFIRPWDAIELPGLSLRLAPHLTHCYNYGDALQPLPAFTSINGYLSWSWGCGSYSWNYPLSVDGHLYYLEELRPMIEALDFTSPNTLEAGLQVYVPRFLGRAGFCYPQSRVVNVPWNTVQSNWQNRQSTEGYTAEVLLQRWEVGYQIALSAFEGVENRSEHQEFPLLLEQR